MYKDDFFKTLTFALFSILFFVMVIISIVTFVYHDTTLPVLAFLVKHHIIIMVLSMFLSLGYGFFWSQLLLQQVKQEKKSSHAMSSVILQLLSHDERKTLQHLFDQGGKTTQAKIAHVNSMGGVKAMRTVQKLEQKRIVFVEKEGKVRHIILNSEFKKLTEQ